MEEFSNRESEEEHVSPFHQNLHSIGAKDNEAFSSQQAKSNNTDKVLPAMTLVSSPPSETQAPVANEAENDSSFRIPHADRKLAPQLPAILKNISALSSEEWADREKASQNLRKYLADSGKDGTTAFIEVAKALVTTNKTDDLEKHRRLSHLFTEQVGTGRQGESLRLNRMLSDVLELGVDQRDEAIADLLKNNKTPKITREDQQRVETALDRLKAARSAIIPENEEQRRMSAVLDRAFTDLKAASTAPDISSQMASLRLNHAWRISKSHPLEALDHLKTAASDNLQRSNDHANFHMAALAALTRVTPEQRQDWLTWAKKTGVDLDWRITEGLKRTLKESPTGQ